MRSRTEERHEHPGQYQRRHPGCHVGQVGIHRDLRQQRPVEVDTILGDLLERGRRGGVRTPLPEAAAVALRIHNDRLASEL
jgi:hypothetical protein